MALKKQIVSYPTKFQRVEHINIDELAALRNRRAIRRLSIQQTLTDRIMRAIAIVSIVNASLFGIGALSCWVLETTEANTKSVIDTKQYEWQTRKHICLGWMLFSFSSLMGSTLGSGKPKA